MYFLFFVSTLCLAQSLDTSSKLLNTKYFRFDAPKNWVVLSTENDDYFILRENCNDVFCDNMNITRHIDIEKETHNEIYKEWYSVISNEYSIKIIKRDYEESNFDEIHYSFVVEGETLYNITYFFFYADQLFIINFLTNSKEKTVKRKMFFQNVNIVIESLFFYEK